MQLQTGSPPGLALQRGGGLEGSGRPQWLSVGVTSLGGAEKRLKGVPDREKRKVICPTGSQRQQEEN